MNRFVSERHRRHPARVLFCLLLTAALPVLFWLGLDGLERSAQAGEEEQLRTAVTRAVIQCYAAEGVYPSDLAYLEEHYGLLYDRKQFLVDYQSNGANLLPDVTVLRLYGSEE